MWSAFGAVEKSERSQALKIMGVTAQLIFPSIGAGRFARSKDMEVVYGGCDALNRGMADFVRMMRACCRWAIFLCVTLNVRKSP